MILAARLKSPIPRVARLVFHRKTQWYLELQYANLNVCTVDRLPDIKGHLLRWPIYIVYFAQSAASYIIKYTIIQNELRDQTHAQTYLILN